MPSKKLRLQIAWEAARLMFTREESEYFQAKHKAARRIHKDRIKPADLPTNAEIREQVQVLARLHEPSTSPQQTLLAIRLRAAWWLRNLAAYHPRLIGSVLTASIREGSDIDIHVFSASPQTIANDLEDWGIGYTLERKRLEKDGQVRVFTHIHVKDEFPVELTVYHPSLLGFRFRSSITGKPIERAGLADLERLIAMDHNLDTTEQAIRLSTMDSTPDRTAVFQSLLVPLERVKQDPFYHPEGDALFHSLQVYELAKNVMPYDEEFLLAALLHDVGKAIDPRDHVAAGLEALDGFITPRTQWLIAHHMDMHKVYDRTIGARHLRRLKSHPCFEDLEALGKCDRNGRVPGAIVPTLDAALDYIEGIEELFGF